MKNAIKFLFKNALWSDNPQSLKSLFCFFALILLSTAVIALAYIVFITITYIFFP